MSKKITLTNIYSFFEGYSRLIQDKLVGLKPHEQEQIQYRMLLCKDDCAKQGSCVKCGCDYPAKLFNIKSCNPERFPDIMNRTEWNKFKLTNNIDG